MRFTKREISTSGWRRRARRWTPGPGCRTSTMTFQAKRPILALTRRVSPRPCTGHVVVSIDMCRYTLLFAALRPPVSLSAQTQRTGWREPSARPLRSSRCSSQAASSKTAFCSGRRDHREGTHRRRTPIGRRRRGWRVASRRLQSRRLIAFAESRTPGWTAETTPCPDYC